MPSEGAHDPGGPSLVPRVGRSAVPTCPSPIPTPMRLQMMRDAEVEPDDARAAAVDGSKHLGAPFGLTLSARWIPRSWAPWRRRLSRTP